MSRLKLLIWYLKRPNLYFELLRIFKKIIFEKDVNIYKKISSTNLNSLREKVISDEEIFFELTGEKLSNFFTKIYFDFIDEAKDKIEGFSEKMAGYDNNNKGEIFFTSGGSNINLIFAICESIGARNVLETGVAYGWSSSAILFSIKNRKNSKLVSVDMPYPGKNNDQDVGIIIPTDLKKYWTLLRYADKEGIPKALKILKNIDFCHYDSDKSYDGRMLSYKIIWDNLSKNGIFYSDDIADNNAFIDFCRKNKLKPLIGSVPSVNGEKLFGLVKK